MPRSSRFLIAVSVLIATLYAAAPSARAEHIFFKTAVNGRALNASSGDSARTSGNINALGDAGGNTIVSPDGQFTFTLTCFNLFRFGEGGVVNYVFRPGESSTIDTPLPQMFNYNGRGTEKKPQTFSFSEFFPRGVFVGDLVLTYDSTSGQPEREVIIYPITLISQPIPEPTTMLLLATGLSGLALKAGRRRRKDAR